MRLQLITVKIFFLAMVFMVSSPVWAQDIPLLFVERDNKSLELAISKYLQQRTSWPVGVAYFDNQKLDAYLNIPFTLEDGRSVTIYIDTFSSATESKERRINIYGHFIIPGQMSHERRAATLEVLNQHMVDDWMMQRLYLDKADDIAFAWVINIPGKDSPVHAEQVYDAILRTKFSLDKLVGKLRPLGLP